MIRGGAFAACSYVELGDGVQMRLSAKVIPTTMPKHVPSVKPAFAFPVGQVISRTSYAALFAPIGTTYGGGDGSTTYNLPDKTGRVSAMKEAAASRLTATCFGGNSAALGAIGGLESHTPTTAQLASHSHGVTDPGHSHSCEKATTTQNQSGTATPVFVGNASATTGASTTGISINNSGGGGAHNDVQPTIICSYIIRVL